MTAYWSTIATIARMSTLSTGMSLMKGLAKVAMTAATTEPAQRQGEG